MVWNTIVIIIFNKYQNEDKAIPNEKIFNVTEIKIELSQAP